MTHTVVANLICCEIIIIYIGQPKKMWKMQVKKKSKSVGLEKEDALNRARWRVEVGEIAVRVE